MKKWSMIVDTGDYGYVTLKCEAENKEEAEKKFREQVNSDTFDIIYGSLYDFKKHTIKEIEENAG